jgi:hypothetical protein
LSQQGSAQRSEKRFEVRSDAILFRGRNRATATFQTSLHASSAPWSSDHGMKDAVAAPAQFLWLR